MGVAAAHSLPNILILTGWCALEMFDENRSGDFMVTQVPSIFSAPELNH
jgi:hypothetical protein